MELAKGQRRNDGDTGRPTRRRHLSRSDRRHVVLFGSPRGQFHHALWPALCFPSSLLWHQRWAVQESSDNVLKAHSRCVIVVETKALYLVPPCAAVEILCLAEELCPSAQVYKVAGFHPRPSQPCTPSHTTRHCICDTSTSRRSRHMPSLTDKLLTTTCSLHRVSLSPSLHHITPPPSGASLAVPAGFTHVSVDPLGTDPAYIAQTMHPIDYSHLPKRMPVEIHPLTAPAGVLHRHLAYFVVD
ncbi:hypothetical protein L226DRAFT_156429 [Lentinus tigrinus ALCF2SS1-7]|uniref:Uncharacterized protein n=1 Tax=Lentinus tigrinus ALCF2SS1-6 TaxID=1328759 RepID=A0A5C2S3Q7_9APHY|nr:hypothetical protein L227DRAFT_197204 [Lentinus tigrinus ALCF2SS1-6]RPD72175.1 hypothetical protein L226DRAFT_156429 [Lentinus tigrinus ALCF2SS1-7]